MNGTVTAEDVKILKDLTGEDRLDAAVHMTLKDAVEHKLEKIEDGIKAFERKHGAKFNDFKKKWESGEIKGKYTRPIEKDFMEWEALLSRKKRLEKALKWLR